LAGEIRENRAKEINSVRDTEETKAKECVQDWIDTYEDIRSDNMDTTEVQECLTKWNPGTPHGR
jgi:DNA/RNA-binding domain of Phe-tRNA-synthetase-like protein